MKATDANGLSLIKDCYIQGPGAEPFSVLGLTFLGNSSFSLKTTRLPDISDSKSAAYTDEAILGRSFPLKTYSHSENRTISWTHHFSTLTRADIEYNLRALRTIESWTYPRIGTPYLPPPICLLKCGKVLAEEALCGILKSYSVKFPTDAVWDETSYLPYNFDVDMTWEVVYKNHRGSLPGQEKIVRDGG